ncbi:RusA family crossover junction endodeoxyribonuclease [Anaeromassilibacillus senegalensis]|uniref:RusA family crossover junction endodeoxyribonuclease n=1 Tax=Anaeromassilibacillus senegalensis TaxID=1673717 RepID=UPI0006817F9B|nr:RusA family crossover junction endodeoxyribonuclease [Anaeromassilibacillus senegalensis]
MRISFTIPGPPQGKARPRVVRIKSGDSVSYNPDKTVAYEELVRLRFHEAAKKAGLEKPCEVPVCMAIVALFPIPKSTSKKRTAAMKRCEILPTKKPDWDNIGKIICDALNGLAYKDDAQVVAASIRKQYTDGAGEVIVSINEI